MLEDLIIKVFQEAMVFCSLNQSSVDRSLREANDYVELVFLH